MKSPAVTLVVPCYNGLPFLEWTLDSIARQTLSDFECIVVDDASTDGSAAMISSFCRRDPRFRLIKHRANAGLSASRNTGLRAARGQYIAFLDADDLLNPEGLALRYETLREISDPACVGTYCGSISIPEGARVPPATVPQTLKVVDLVTSSGQCPFNANQPMFKTALLRRFGGFNEKLKQAEDYDYWLRLLRAGFFFAPTNFRAVTYRSRSGSMVRRGPLDHLGLSLALAQSVYQRRGANFRYPDSPGFLSDSMSTYKFQIDNINRAFQFAGMAVAAGADASEIQKVIRPYFSSLNGIVRRHRRYRDLVLDGVKRSVGNVEQLSLDEANALDARISEVLVMAMANTRDEVYPKIEEPNSYLDNVPYSAPWHPGRHAQIDLVFLPHKDYHVWTIKLLSKALDAAGVKWIVCDLSAQYRDEGVRAAGEKYGVPLVGYSNLVLGNYSPRMLVSFNDWDPIVGSIFDAAQDAGILTAAIVEGVQDYHDADTRRVRHPYRSADYIFLPGEFDRRYFQDSAQKLSVVGVPRVAALRGEQPVAAGSKRVLINSNFSYGVLEDVRDDWVRAVVAAVLEAGGEPVISRHPADKGEAHPEFVSKDDFYTSARSCGLSIQRFGSGMLEAPAMGIPAIYFNPHSEKVDKYQYDGCPAPMITTREALVAHLREPASWLFRAEDWSDFLDMHTGAVSLDGPAAFASAVREAIADVTDRPRLTDVLAALDERSAALSDVAGLRATRRPKFASAEAMARAAEYAALFAEQQAAQAAALSLVVVESPSEPHFGEVLEVGSEKAPVAIGGKVGSRRQPEGIEWAFFESAEPGVHGLQWSLTDIAPDEEIAINLQLCATGRPSVGIWVWGESTQQKIDLWIDLKTRNVHRNVVDEGFTLKQFEMHPTEDGFVRCLIRAVVTPKAGEIFFRINARLAPTGGSGYSGDGRESFLCKAVKLRSAKVLKTGDDTSATPEAAA